MGAFTPCRLATFKSGIAGRGLPAMKTVILRKASVAWGLYVVEAMAVNSLIVLAQYRVFSPTGDSDLLVLAWILEAVVGVSTVALFGLLVGILCRKGREKAIRPLAVLSIYVVVGFSAMGIALSVRRHGFNQLAERSQPLVRAIEQFERKVGHPPEALEQLVPEYLDSVPETGLGVSQKCVYLCGQDERGRRVQDVFRGSAWVLHVPIPDMLTEWRGITYWPRSNSARYPSDRGFGHAGDWIITDGSVEAAFVQGAK